eukprot:7850220-Karenia_brevis.AAC.1
MTIVVGFEVPMTVMPCYKCWHAHASQHRSGSKCAEVVTEHLVTFVYRKSYNNWSCTKNEGDGDDDAADDAADDDDDDHDDEDDDDDDDHHHHHDGDDNDDDDDDDDVDDDDADD